MVFIGLLVACHCFKLFVVVCSCLVVLVMLTLKEREAGVEEREGRLGMREAEVEEEWARLQWGRRH